jgi:hypothetical protein
MTNVSCARGHRLKAAPRLPTTLLLLSVCLLPLGVISFSPLHETFERKMQFAATTTTSTTSLFSAPNDQAVEALRSLTDFHEGVWKGVATSFTVTNDVAAGIVQRKTSPPYTVLVKLGVGDSDYTLTETITVPDDDDDTVCRRKLSLAVCNMDVDSVDASYSLDATLPDFPAAVAGTAKLLHFGIEHCIATSDNSRTRCLAFYGADEQLSRIVVCHEERVVVSEQTAEKRMGPQRQQHLTTRDLIEMQSDVDRLVDKITGNGTQRKDKNIQIENGSLLSQQQQQPSSKDNNLMDSVQAALSGTSSASNNARLSPHVISLLELSSGVWVGDSIIRDVPLVPTSPLELKRKGFGGASSKTGSQPAAAADSKIPFASWTVGVQKMAWRWMWNFGEEIRQVIDVGRGMGAQLSEPLTRSLSGSVCVNEGLSRRIPKVERMVYIDWEGDNVGFICGSVSIQVRLVSFWLLKSYVHVGMIIMATCLTLPDGDDAGTPLSKVR